MASRSSLQTKSAALKSRAQAGPALRRAKASPSGAGARARASACFRPRSAPLLTASAECRRRQGVVVIRHDKVALEARDGFGESRGPVQTATQRRAPPQNPIAPGCPGQTTPDRNKSPRPAGGSGRATLSGLACSASLLSRWVLRLRRCPRRRCPLLRRPPNGRTRPSSRSLPQTAHEASHFHCGSQRHAGRARPGA